MALQGSGPISLNDIQTEFGGSNPIGLSEYYRGGSYTTGNNTGVPTGGTLSLSSFYGTSAFVPPTVTLLASGNGYGATVDLGTSTTNRMIVIMFSIYTNQQDGSPGSNLSGMTSDWGSGGSYHDQGFLYGNPSNTGSTYVAFNHSGADKRVPSYAIFLLENILSSTPVSAQADSILLSCASAALYASGISSTASDGTLDQYNEGVNILPSPSTEMSYSYVGEYDSTGSESISVSWGSSYAPYRRQSTLRFK